MDYKYYLYRHIRLDTNKVFYVGVGTNTNKKYVRANSCLKRNIFWNRVVNKTRYEVEILLESNDYDFILSKEKEFIKLYGRRDLGLGTLCNLTDGGEGSPNSTRFISDWQKKRISLANTGRKKTKEQIEKHRVQMLGKKQSQETKDKRSLSSKDKIFSEETKNKISKAKKGVKPHNKSMKWKRVENTITGEVYKSISKAAKLNNIRRCTLGIEILKGEYKNLELIK